MRLLWPKSLLKLTLLGFSLTALPLLIAFVGSLIYMQRLADQSQQAIYQAVQVTQSSQRLGEQIRSMERSAQQYVILNDPLFLENFTQVHKAFQETRARLWRLPLSRGQRAELQALAQIEQQIFARLGPPPTDPQVSAELSARLSNRFNAAAELSQAILEESNRLIGREVGKMKASVQTAQRYLLLMALLLVPATLAFVAVFTFLINRPIRQMEQAIHRLGALQMESEIRISGPQDLQQLGMRLEWLRCRLLDLEEQKKKFLRHVSHELKTPLTAMREGTDLLAEEVVGGLSPEQREVTSILQQNSGYLQKLIEDLLNFNAAQARNAVLDMRALDLAELVTRVAGNHRLSAKAKHLDMVLELERVVVPGDRDKIATVIDNLLSNAVKYCAAGGRIRVVLKAAAEAALLDVMDSGPGIDPADKERLFEAFYQGRTRAQGPVQGTGIGLSIAKEFAEAHRGAIEIMEGSSGGAHFRVTLPLNQDIKQAV